MECKDCGAEKEDTKIYGTSFEMNFEGEVLFSLKLSKALCAECLKNNIAVLIGEVRFLQEEDGEDPDKLDIYKNKELLNKILVDNN